MAVFVKYFQIFPIKTNKLILKELQRVVSIGKAVISDSDVASLIIVIIQEPINNRVIKHT